MIKIRVNKKCVADVSLMVKGAIKEAIEDVGIDKIADIPFRAYDFYVGDIAIKYVPDMPIAQDDEPDYDDGSDEIYERLVAFLEKQAEKIFIETISSLKTARDMIKQALA